MSTQFAASVPDDMADRMRLQLAFQSLQTLGYSTQMDIPMGEEVPQPQTDRKEEGQRWVYWTFEEGVSAFGEDGGLEEDLQLMFQGNWQEIHDVLQAVGFSVECTPQYVIVHPRLPRVCLYVVPHGSSGDIENVGVRIAGSESRADQLFNWATGFRYEGADDATEADINEDTSAFDLARVHPCYVPVSMVVRALDLPPDIERLVMEHANKRSKQQG